MPMYVTFIPGFEVNAEVDAPDTKHARTAFLDYLQRNHIIGWDERQAYRKRVKTIRSEPDEYPTTIHLDYDMQDGPPTVVLAGTQPPQELLEEAAPEEPVYDSSASYTTHPSQSKNLAQAISGYSQSYNLAGAGQPPPKPMESQPQQLPEQPIPESVMGRSPIADVARQLVKVNPRLKRGY